MPTDALLSSLVADAFDAIATIGPDLTVGYANAAAGALLGTTPEDLLGRPVDEIVHPEDLQRALLLMGSSAEWGAPRGTAGFRLRRADGTWVLVDMSSALVSDGVDDHFAVYCRPADSRQATEEVLRRLLAGEEPTSVLEPVLESFDWRPNDLAVAIAWYEPGIGHQVVSTGLPASLAGAEDAPGEPWARARDELEEAFVADPDDLDPDRARLARAHGRGSLWVVPVSGGADGVPALVTAWGRADGPTPRGHAYGMANACSFVELILRWSSQVRQLEAAAHRDALTGVANRKALHDRLRSDEVRGAVLYCDLDRFKSVNDRYGHAAGDAVLRAVATRIQDVVRATDVVARIGGDEFVVVAEGADPSQAEELARRIRTEVGRSVEVGDLSVRVGITVGVAHAPDGIDDATMIAADRALLRAKAEGRDA